MKAENQPLVTRARLLLPSPAPAVTSPVRDAPVEVIDPVIEAVADGTVPPPVADELSLSLATTLARVEAVAQPVLEQPVINNTLGFVDHLVAVPVGTLSLDHAPSSIVMKDPASTAPWAAGSAGPEPAAVLLMTAAADTRAAQVPAAGSTHFPRTSITVGAGFDRPVGVGARRCRAGPARLPDRTWAQPPVGTGIRRPAKRHPAAFCGLRQ